MKYMIMMYNSQRDHDMMAGQRAGRRGWSPEEFATLHSFIESWNGDLVDSGEFVDAAGLSSPSHTRRVRSREGVPLVTDAPFADTDEVLCGYTIVECDSFDRATAVAARVADIPYPRDAALDHEWFVDVRPIVEGTGHGREGSGSRRRRT